MTVAAAQASLDRSCVRFDARTRTRDGVRIGLNLKGIEYESRQINLLEGEQRSDEYRALAEVRRAHSRGSLVAVTGYDSTAATSPKTPASAS